MNTSQRAHWIATFAEIADNARKQEFERLFYALDDADAFSVQWLATFSNIYRKMVERAQRALLDEIEECYALPAGDCIQDVINSFTGLTSVYGKTEEQMRVEHPTIRRMLFSAYMDEKATRQDTPVGWIETTEEKYTYALEVLPPVDWNGGAAFLVGEPVDNHAGTGRPRFDGYFRRGSKYWHTSRAVTVAEFRTLARP